MAAPTYPPPAELEQKLAAYVDADTSASSADPQYITDITAEVVDWLTLKIADHENVPVTGYLRAFLEVGAQMWRRRRSWGNTDQLEAPSTPPVRKDPYSIGEEILAQWLGAVIA